MTWNSQLTCSQSVPSIFGLFWAYMPWGTARTLVLAVASSFSSNGSFFFSGSLTHVSTRVFSRRCFFLTKGLDLEWFVVPSSVTPGKTRVGKSVGVWFRKHERRKCFGSNLRGRELLESFLIQTTRFPGSLHPLIEKTSGRLARKH